MAKTYQLPPNTPDPLTPAELAAACSVSTTTVTRWANAHQVECFRTLGGHRRFPLRGVLDALHAGRIARRVDG